MMQDGAIIPALAQIRLDGLHLDRIERTRLVTEPAAAPLVKGVKGIIGVVAGSLAFDSKRSVERG